MDVEKKPTGMILEGVIAAETFDSSGEQLIIDGVDITDFKEGRAVVNYEHKSEKDSNGEEVVGKVVAVKKIHSKDECDTDTQRQFWDNIKVPLIWARMRLFDGAGHSGAQALAAAIRDQVANHEKILCRWSIEGSTLDKQGNRLMETVARRVALTWKPCNRACDTKLVVDPNAPEGFEKIPGEDETLKFENPEFTRLGGYDGEYNPVVEDGLTKALEAGMPTAAPSALVGGAALQKENIKGRVLATLRDFGSKKKFDRTGFRLFAKVQMPEASDEFLDHFSDVAEDYHVKRSQLTKKEAAPKIAAPKVAPVEEPVADDDEEGVSASEIRNLQQGTIRGVPQEPHPDLPAPTFDENNGVLHTKIGSFPLYKPEPEHFHNLLSDPKVEEFHNKAMENWTKVHKLLKEGRVPPELIAHAAIFSQLSANVPVPMQELMYAKLIDTMHLTDSDPREPGFRDKAYGAWMGLDQPDLLPEHSRDYFENHPGVHLKGPREYKDKEGNEIRPPRDAGDLAAYNLADSKMDKMDMYHRMHDALVKLVGKHRGDVRSAVAEMMAHKSKFINWNAKRANAIRAGKPDIGNYPGMEVHGLAPKTARYMMGMIGGGNVFVPDTHMVRHISGLENGKDKVTIAALKNLMWNERNSHILDGIDRWYAANHPAVQHMVQHPIWGKHFESPEDAIFPAFWKHWIGIGPDERSRGMVNRNHTEGTTHAPFWEAVDPFLDGLVKSEAFDYTLPMRTARVHAQYVKDYGEVPAAMMYFHHLVPHLLDNAEQRAKRGKDLKFLAKKMKIDALDIELRKALSEVERHPTLVQTEMPTVARVHVKIGDNHHQAGRYAIIGNRLHHLEDYYGLLGRLIPEGKINEKTISKLHGLKSSPHMKVEDANLDLSAPQQAEPEPEVEEPQKQIQPPSVFHYHRVGMDKPHTLEVAGGQYLLDGNKISEGEVKKIVSNIQSGAASIRYSSNGLVQRIQKMERVFETLSKAEEDMDPGQALQHIRAAVAAGHIHPDVERALTRHIYEDELTPGIGNKKAWVEFESKKRPGIYLVSDLNHFKSINDAFGHPVGDQAISAYGSAARDAMEEQFGKGVGKVFRSGGDENVMWVPSYEHAAKFARALTAKVDALPAIEGVHKISTSLGIGHTHEMADKALYLAKEGKKGPNGNDPYKPGTAPNFIHSLVPGKEGPVPVQNPTAATIKAVNPTPELTDSAG